MDRLVNPQLSPLEKSKKTEQKLPLQIGDRVTAFDDNGNPVRGTVQWVGMKNRDTIFGGYIAGMYTVSLHTHTLSVLLII